MCVSIWRAVSVAVGDLDPFGPKFSVGLFDCWAAHPYNQIKMESKMIGYLFIRFLKNIFIAPWKLAVVKARLSASDKTWLYSIPYISSFVASFSYYWSSWSCLIMVVGLLECSFIFVLSLVLPLSGSNAGKDLESMETLLKISLQLFSYIQM